MECVPRAQSALLRSLRLTHTGAETFFTLRELMAANLRALLAAYAIQLELFGAAPAA